MIRVNFNVPLGVPNLGTPFKCIWAGLAAAGASVLGNLIGGKVQSGYTKEHQRLQSKLNREEMSYSAGLQRDAQQWQANLMPGKQVSAMKNAGLNPAMDGGASLGGASGASSGATTGGTGPAAPSSSLGSDAVASYQQGELLQAQVDNIKAQTDKLKSEKDNVDADTVIKRWQGSPRYTQLVENGLDASAANAWASANLSDKQSFKCIAEVQKIGKDMELTDSQINELQARTAETYRKIEKLKGEIGLQKFEKFLKLSQVRLNDAMAHKAKADANEANERVNSGLYKSQANLNWSKSNEAEANENLLRKKGFTEDEIRKCKEIESELLSFENDVNHNYGATDKAGLQYANDLVRLVTGGLLGGSAPRTSYSHMVFQR